MYGAKRKYAGKDKTRWNPYKRRAVGTHNSGFVPKSRSLLPLGRGPSSGLRTPLGRQLTTKLRYAEFINLEPGIAGIAGVQVVSANGLFDPDISGTGHQPTGFDQLMAFYNHYTVTGAKITATFSNTDDGNSSRVGIALLDSLSVLTDYRRYLESGNCSFSALAEKGGNDSVTLTNVASVRKFQSVSNPTDDNTLAGTVSANPAEGMFFHLFAAPGNTADALTVQVHYVVEYQVTFHGPINLAVS